MLTDEEREFFLEAGVWYVEVERVEVSPMPESRLLLPREQGRLLCTHCRLIYEPVVNWSKYWCPWCTGNNPHYPNPNLELLDWLAKLNDECLEKGTKIRKEMQDGEGKNRARKAKAKEEIPEELRRAIERYESLSNDGRKKLGLKDPRQKKKNENEVYGENDPYAERQEEGDPYLKPAGELPGYTAPKLWDGGDQYDDYDPDEDVPF